MTVEAQVTDTSNQENELAAMSDDEFLNAIEPLPVEPQTEQAVATPEAQKTESVSTETQQPEVTTAATTKVPADVPASTEDKPNEQPATEVQAEAATVNHKEFYEALTKPFKANGREIQITDPNDAIKLMQMGTDYNRKMQELKPLKQLKAVMTQHSISEEDLALLIDIKQNKPEAIAKIVKDSGIDLYGFDVEQADKYVPTQPQVPEVNEALDSVLEDLKVTSPTFAQTIQVVGNQWDAASRDVLVQHPELIRVIDAQIANGTYAKIAQVVEYERTLGRLNGLSDLQAYSEVERKMLAASQAAPKAPTPVAVPVVVPPVQAPVVDARKSAAPPRQTTANTQPIPINSPALSDEEFLKQLAAQGLN